MNAKDTVMTLIMPISGTVQVRLFFRPVVLGSGLVLSIYYSETHF